MIGNYIGPTPIHTYGCTACQRYHRLGLDAEFEAHVGYQSKHGISTRAPRGPRETFVAEVLAEERRTGKRDDSRYGA